MALSHNWKRERRLNAASKTFVEPFYMDMLHGNILRRPVAEQSDFVREVHAAAEVLDEEAAALLLDAPEWRGRLAVSWLIGLRGWQAFAPQMGDLLLRSELVYAGQGFAVGLALMDSDESANQLHRYLDRWLREVNCFYDQHWAMSALLEIDRRQGGQYAERHLEQWAIWASHNGRDSPAAAVSDIVDLLAIESRGLNVNTAAAAKSPWWVFWRGGLR